MTNPIPDLVNRKLAHPPPWLSQNTMFLGITGSVAYGASDNNSDVDIYGFAIPPRELVFPHLSGEIQGFGRQINRFDQWQQHHIIDKEHRKEYDFTVFNIVKFFHLCMEMNPNMCDTLFLPRRCVLHSTQCYEHVRENRKKFLHKGAFFKFRGYSFAQMAKINSGANRSNQKRQAAIEKFGYDTKFAMHCVRLLLEIEQIMLNCDLSLDRDSETYKSIRKGEWTLEDIQKWVSEKERALESLYVESKLPHSPDEPAIKKILLECLEMHYGSLDAVIHIPTKTEELVNELKLLVDRYEGK